VFISGMDGEYLDYTVLGHDSTTIRVIRSLQGREGATYSRYVANHADDLGPQPSFLMTL